MLNVSMPFSMTLIRFRPTRRIQRSTSSWHTTSCARTSFLPFWRVAICYSWSCT